MIMITIASKKHYSKLNTNKFVAFGGITSCLLVSGSCVTIHCGIVLVILIILTVM